MNFKLILLTTLLIQSFAWGQNDTINQIDESEKKQGYWIYYGKDLPELGFPKEGIVKEGIYKDNKKKVFGKCTTWTEFM